MARAYIGTSGWQYKHWKHSFYEGKPEREWLEYASNCFTSLEADGTFYRLQKKETFERWAERTPKDFKFAIRGHRYTTHQKKLLDPIATIDKQKEPASGLGKKLAVVLWQLPPFMRKNVPRLKEFALALQSTWPEVRHALEFRHETWFDDEVAALLSEFKLANTISDAGKWPRWDAVTTDLVYVRLHGKPDTYWSGYSSDELDEWATKVELWLSQGREVHFYFDNDAQERAPWEALDLLKRIRKPIETPEPHKQLKPKRARQRQQRISQN
jgi:uncharacterized protein YecE (DUF72 family)